MSIDEVSLDYARPKHMQDEREIDRLAEILKGECVKSYLEIGSKYGGSLWRIAPALEPGARIVLVDLPNGTREWKLSNVSLKSCAAILQAMGFEVHLIWGDSTAPDVIEKVKALGPFDAAFIDANHTMPFVLKDWMNYGSISRIVAFHDIGWRRGPDWKDGIRIDVPEFWAAIKNDFRHEEIKLCPTGKNNGIGVLWR